MNKLLLILYVIVIGLFDICYAQQKIYNEISSRYKSTNPTAESLFSRELTPIGRPEFLEKNAIHREFEIDQKLINTICTTKPQELSLTLPIDGINHTLLLILAEESDPVPIKHGSTMLKSDYRSTIENIHYYGIIENDPNSLVSFSVINKKMYALVSNRKGNVDIVPVGKSSTRYTIIPNWNTNIVIDECESDQLDQGEFNTELLGAKINQSATASMEPCVNVYFEADFETYKKHNNSIPDTEAYIHSLFNQVKIIYLNESINVKISEIFVWTTLDPYTHNGSSITILSEFANRMSGGFNGNVAHLLSSKIQRRGGIAYLNTLCASSKRRTGFSEMVNHKRNYPTFSFDVFVVAHEIGHNIASPHTHACAWNGNHTAIDGCSSIQGNCPNPGLPTVGTIMSYCYSQSGVGVSLAAGFGPQPGDLLRNRIANSGCAGECCVFKYKVDLGPNTEICENESIKLDAGGLNEYSYLWSTGETSQIITVTQPGVYEVTVTGDCGHTTDSIEITENTGPTVSMQDQYTLCINSVDVDATTPDAVSYEWSTGETTEIVTLTTTGNYWVRVYNDCTFTEHNFEVIVDTNGPDLNLQDQYEICDSGVELVASTQAADSYVWSTGETTETITVTSLGNYWVRVYENCAYTEHNFEVIENTTGGPQLGLQDAYEICDSGVELVATTDGAVSYLWSTGETTETITVNQLGIYTVKVYDECTFTEHSFEVVENTTGGPDLNLQDQYEMCDSGVELVATTDSAVSYLWSTGETTETISVTQLGTYTVNVYDECTHSEHTFEVVENTTGGPELNLISEYSICNSEIDLVATTPGAVNYLWSTGETTDVISVQSEGSYWVKVYDDCTFSEHSIEVISNSQGPTLNLLDEYEYCLAGVELIADTKGATSYLWSTGETTSKITVHSIGSYWVEVSNDCGLSKLDIEVVENTTGKPNLNLLDQYEYCLSGVVLDATTDGATSYVWSTGETTETITVDAEGTYWVQVYNECAYSQHDFEVTPNITGGPTLDLLGEYEYCLSGVELDATTADATGYLWSTGETTETITVDAEGTYWVHVFHECAYTPHEFEVIPNTSGGPTLNLLDEYELCYYGVELDATTTGATSYLWSTGETTETISVDTEGSYWVQVFNDCAYSEHSFEVTPNSPGPEVDLPSVFEVCANSIEIDATTENAVSYVWSTGETSQTVQFTSFGEYWVRVYDECSFTQHHFELIPGPELENNLESEYQICQGETLILSMQADDVNYLWSTGETTAEVSFTEPGEYWGEISNLCGTSRVEFNIEEDKHPEFLGFEGSQELCAGSSTEITILYNHADEIIWSNGQTGESVSFDEQGEYTVLLKNSCSEIEVPILITAQEHIEVELEDQYLVCAEELLNLDLSIPNATYYWHDDESTSPQKTISEPGEYSVTISKNGCSTTKTTTVDYLEKIVLELGDDKVACLKDSVELYVNAKEGESILWSDGSTSSLFVAAETGTYSVDITNICETATDKIYIEFIDCCIAQLPSAFAPNQNNNNEVLKPLIDCTLQEYLFEIFDRWGNKVFTTSEIGFGWDGTNKGLPAQQGTYMWILSYQDKESGLRHEFHGNSMLIR